MEKKMETNWLIGIGLIVVVVICLLYWLISSSNTPSTVTVNTPAPVTPVVVPPTPTEDITPGSVDSGAGAATIAYSDALVKYANARLQLDDNCQADSQSQRMTFRNGSLLMIDNRSDLPRTVHIGSVFTVKAYGFKIIKLSSATLPATWLVDCDSSQNVATIILQK
jgi:hypothetical protein